MWVSKVTPWTSSTLAGQLPKSSIRGSEIWKSKLGTSDIPDIRELPACSWLISFHITIYLEYRSNISISYQFQLSHISLSHSMCTGWLVGYPYIIYIYPQHVWHCITHYIFHNQSRGPRGLLMAQPLVVQKACASSFGRLLTVAVADLCNLEDWLRDEQVAVVDLFLSTKRLKVWFYLAKKKLLSEIRTWISQSNGDFVLKMVPNMLTDPHSWVPSMVANQ